MKTIAIGIDLAKEVIAIHGVDDRGRAILRKQLKRNEMAKFFVNLEPGNVRAAAGRHAHRMLDNHQLDRHKVHKQF